MTSTWIATLLAVGCGSAVPLVTLVALAGRDERWRRLIPFLVSFAVGALLGGAVLHLLPEAAERMGSGRGLSFGLLGGFLGFFVLEKFAWAHQHRRPTGTGGVRSLVTVNLVGDALHNLIDGAVIAASYSTESALGLTTTVAVLLHEVPQEIGDFGVLVYGGLSVPRAVLLNVLAALTAIAGAVLTLLIGRELEGFTTALLPVAAGGFLYIAAADLVPELQRERRTAVSVAQSGLIVLGIALLALPVLG